MIIDKIWLRKHNTLLNMINDELAFRSNTCDYENAVMNKDRLKTPEPLKEELKEKSVVPIKILKRPIVNEKSKTPKEPRLKQPQVENEPEKPIKKPVSPKVINITQIGAVPFMQLIKKKDYKLFTIIMRDINKYLEKEEKPLIDPCNILLKEYHKFLDVFLKELIDKLLPYRPYNHKIKLLADSENHIKNAPLYLISIKELIIIKKYLEENLNKEFIVENSASIISPVLFIYKPDGELQFYINYRKLNAIIKKNKYLISLIEKIMI